MKSTVCILLILGAAVQPLPAAAQAGRPDSRLQAALSLYVWGFTVGKMDLDASLRGPDYRAVSHFKTYGLASILWPSEITATSSGQAGSKGLTPALYDSFDIGRGGKRQQVSLRYEGDAAPRLIADPPYSTTGYEVKADDIRSTLDPLSAVMLIASGIAAQPGNPCGFTAPVFDGRRRYDVALTKTGDVDVRLDNGAYHGKAVACDVRYRQLAGFRPSVLKSNDSFPVIHAWIARFPNPATGGEYAIPVRVWADTRYGRLTVQADSLRVDGAVSEARSDSPR